MKTRIVLLTFFCSVLTASAQFYSDVTFVGSVHTGSYYAVSGIAAAVTNGGYYTNAVATTNFYRLSGTNLSGRIPLSTNVVVVWTPGVGTNAVTLSWTRAPGIQRHVVEKSLDAGATWANWLGLGPGVTSWVDTGSNVWTASVYTNLYSQIASGTYPWASSGDIANSVTGTPALVEDTYNAITRVDAHDLHVTIRTNYLFIPPPNSLMVSGSLTPAATGLYLPFGDYFGEPTWRREDGAYFIYHNHGGPDWYILSPELPAGGVSWVFTAGGHPPLGEWAENNGVSGIATSSFAPRILDLTGVTVVPATNVYHFIGPGFTNSITATPSNFTFTIHGTIETNGYWP